MSVTELLGGAIGSMLFALGGASVVTWAVHRRRHERVLLFFGIWCALYGARLISEQPTITTAVGGPDRSWLYFQAFVTYIINVPIGLFFEAIIGQGWKGSVRRMWQVLAIYAAGAVVTDLVAGRPEAAMPLNSPLILIAISLALVNSWMFRDRLSPTMKSRAIGAGAIVMLFFVVNENLRRPIVPSVHLEPIGVFAFVTALGYGVVGSVFRQEAELVAVQRELETARRIQSGLLPRTVPELPDLELAARYLPMTAVAGDFYDFVTLGESRVGIFVADVSGHGVPAAIVASMVKLAFAAQAEHASNPAAVLGAMNRMLCHHADGTFVTAIYAVIDTSSRTVTLACAGHPSLLVGRSDGTLVESTERGPMLGLSADASYAVERLDLRDGDRLLLFTDGIPEAQNPGGEFLDTDRIAEWLVAGDGDASEFADSMLGALRRWRGAAGFEDDVTFVVARVGPRVA